jgi:hypothetical protein
MIKGLLLLLLTHSVAPCTVNQASYKPKRAYLGSIKNTQGAAVYHIAISFRAVPSAIVPHGCSEVCFYDRNWQIAAIYKVGLPGALPVSLRNNTLIFNNKLKNNQANAFQQVISPLTAPPAWLCVAANDCYHREKP